MGSVLAYVFPFCSLKIEVNPQTFEINQGEVNIAAALIMFKLSETNEPHFRAEFQAYQLI